MQHFKGDRTSALDPLSGEAAPLFDPRRQRWGEHFAWTHGGRRVAGRTAIGRATVEALRLNRMLLVGAHALWVRFGAHPPQGIDDDPLPPG